MTRIILTTSQLYVPTTTRRAVRVKVWGGGGGGAGGNANETQCWGGGSGGGGAYVSQVLAFHKEVGVPMEVGAGGVAGGTASPGGPGGASSVGRLRAIFAPGGGGGPAANPETVGVAARGGQASAARGRLKASGGGGNVSLVFSPSSEGSGGGGAGGKNGDGGYGLGGSDFVQGAGGSGGPDGGAGGHGGDSPYFSTPAEAQAGFVPGGGGGGGGAGLVLHPPIIHPLTLSMYSQGPTDHDGNYIFNPQVPDDHILFADLSTLATWHAPATPLAIVFVLKYGPHNPIRATAQVFLDYLYGFDPQAWEPALGVYTEFAFVALTNPVTKLRLDWTSVITNDLATAPWVFEGDYYAIDSDGAQSPLTPFSITVTFFTSD